MRSTRASRRASAISDLLGEHRPPSGPQQSSLLSILSGENTQTRSGAEPWRHVVEMTSNAKQLTIMEHCRARTAQDDMEILTQFTDLLCNVKLLILNKPRPRNHNASLFTGAPQ